MMRRAMAVALMAAAIASVATSCAQLPTAPGPQPSARGHEVVAVVDGDTIDVLTAEGEERVRIIGLDSPEIGRDGAADECYAVEAREYLNDLLYGRSVELEADETQDDRDRYGRLLRHVYIDGDSAAVAAIAAGAAYEYTYDVAYEHRAEHVAAEDAARRAAVGLWATC